MSEFSYGGIELELIKTRINRDQVRSQDGVDQIYIKWTFDIDAVFNPGATSYAEGPSQQPGILPTETDVSIRTALMAPRQQLVYTVDGVELLVSPIGDSPVDAFVGPMPISCHVKEIHGTKTYLIAYRIETWIQECQSPDEAANDPVISNRYQIERSTDRQRLTTLTTSGVSVFRMDALASANQGADHFLSNCIPPEPKGFQRQATDIKVSSVGDKILWQVVDREMLFYLGDQASNRYGVEWCEATITQSANPPEGGGANKQSIFIQSNFACRVVGNKDSRKFNLITFAVGLAIQRCQIKAGPVVGKDPLIRQITVSEVLTDRIIDLNIVLMYPPSNQPNAIGLGGIQGQYLGIDILDLLTVGLDNLNMPNDGNTRGTFTGEALVAALKEACLPSPQPDDNQPSSPGDPNYRYTNYEPTSVSISVVDDLEKQSSKYSDETADQGLYTEYSIEAYYDRDWGKIACPVAWSPGASSTSGSTARLAAENRPDAVKYYAPEILTVASPIQYVTFKWVVERNSTKPNFPDKNLTTKNLTLLSDSVRPVELYLAGDGQTPAFRVSGIYRYCRNDAEDLSVNFPFPIVPWTTFEYGQYEITEENLRHGYIDDANSSTGSGGGTPAIEPPGIVR